MTPVDVLYAASETPAPQSDHIKMANGGKKPPRKLEKAKTLSWERPDAQLNATSIGSRPLACTNRRYRRLKHTTNPHVVAWLKVSHVMPTHEHAAKALPTVQGTGARSLPTSCWLRDRQGHGIGIQRDGSRPGQHAAFDDGSGHDGNGRLRQNRAPEDRACAQRRRTPD